MKLLFSSIFVLTQLIGFTQQRPVKLVDTYQIENSNPGVRSCKIPVNFNLDNPLEALPDSLEDRIVERIDLVYTTYALNPTFDQLKLNNSRVAKFKDRFPFVTEKNIQWTDYGQTIAKTAFHAKNLFHGFVVYYRPKPTVETIAKEIAFIDSVVEGNLISSSGNHRIDSGSSTASKKTVKTSISAIPSEFDLAVGSCYEVTKFKDLSDTATIVKFVEKITQLPRYAGHQISVSTSKVPDLYLYQGTYLTEVKDCNYAEATTAETAVLDDWFNAGDYELVQTIYERNTNWQNTHVVMDVTGSMSPYIAKTLAWLKHNQQQNKIDSFTFFNDGDTTPDFAKVIGEVGGIYSVNNTTFDSVFSTLKKAMHAGGGGDVEENNVEAMLSVQSNFKGCDAIVLVADNFATPRDLSLVKQLNVPVRIVLCGALNRTINRHYIQLAYDTKGSIHTIEQDINCQDIKTNKTIKIGTAYYTLFEGKIMIASEKA